MDKKTLEQIEAIVSDPLLYQGRYQGHPDHAVSPPKQDEGSK